MMSVRWVAVLILAASLAACAGYAKPPALQQDLLAQPYRLDSGDRVRVTVFGQADLTNTYVVDQAGWMAIPLIGGVQARGMAVDELERAIASKLRAGYIRSPDVSVEVDQYRPFFIMGEVRNAGQYPFLPGMTVQTAVATAGGFTARARQGTVEVTRTLGTEVVTGPLRLTDPIRPGDTINVREGIF